MSSEPLSIVVLGIRSYFPIWEVKRRTGVWTDTLLVDREAEALLLSPAMIYFRPADKHQRIMDHLHPQDGFLSPLLW